MVEAVPIPTEVMLSRIYSSGSHVKCTGMATGTYKHDSHTSRSACLTHFGAFTLGGDLAYFMVDVISPGNVPSADVLACGMGQWGGLGNGQYLQAQGAPVKVKSVSGITECECEALSSLILILEHPIIR